LEIGGVPESAGALAFGVEEAPRLGANLVGDPGARVLRFPESGDAVESRVEVPVQFGAGMILHLRERGGGTNPLLGEDSERTPRRGAVSFELAIVKPGQGCAR